MNLLAAFAGRVMLALLFIVSGVNKLVDPGPSQAMLATVNLPPVLAVPTGLFEVIAGFAIVAGLFTRFTAMVLAAYCLLTALYFHHNFADPMQAVMALKNFAIAGGFLCLFAHSQVRWSYDGLRARRRADLAAQEAALRERDAEIRQARAEGRAEAAPATLTDPPLGRRRWFGW